jgi:nucleoside-diphosphate kinase
MAIERTFSIIKPDATKRNLTGAVNAVIEKAGLQIVAQKRIRMSLPEARKFYAVHKERPFFRDLVTFMTEGPVVAMVLEGENAVQRWRDLMGPTDAAKAEKSTLRGQFGSNIERNATHGSDATDTAAYEMGFFFSGLELAGL